MKLAVNSMPPPRQMCLLLRTMLLLVISAARALASAKPEIPSFAALCGVQVGRDTMQTLESRLGKGAPCVGGHARGGRQWRISGKRGHLYADGFNSFDKKGITYAG